MVDLEAHFGRAKKAIGYDDLMRVFAADGIKILPGDVVTVAISPYDLTKGRITYRGPLRTNTDGEEGQK